MADKTHSLSGAAGDAPVADRPDTVRNVVLVGPSGSGKTMLVESLLVATGMLTRLGSVPDGTTVSSLGRGGLTTREVFDLISPSLTWRDLERLAGEAGLPVLVKGVLTAEDAALACEHGAAGVVVSNHGGRQLDGVAATIDALPEVVEAVEGRVEVIVDGGIRRGTDVVKALALGARAVLAGRAPLWGLVASGEQGARHVLELLQAEILGALQLVGCRSPAEVTRDHVGRRASFLG